MITTFDYDRADCYAVLFGGIIGRNLTPKVKPAGVNETFERKLSKYNGFCNTMANNVDAMIARLNIPILQI